MLLEKNEFKLENLALEETLFHVANGYLGLRANIDFCKKDYCRGLYINGFYDISDIKYGESFVGFPKTKQGICKLADVQSMNIFVDGKQLCIDEKNVKSYLHRYDMQKGYTERHFKIALEKGDIEINTRRLASFANRQVLMLEYEIKPSFEAKIDIESILDCDVSNFSSSDDPRVASQAEKPLEILSISADDDGMEALMQAKRSKLQFACFVTHSIKPDHVEKHDKYLKSCFNFNVKANESITLYKFIKLKDSFHFSDVEIDKHFESAEYYYNKQIKYLDNFWSNSRITINGDTQLQNALDYSVYSLLCSIGYDEKYSISAKGLSGEGYEGHVFWDSEVYVSPLFVLTDPELAKTQLSYRHNILPFAIEQARLLGHDDGAVYAWRSIEGAECSGYFPSGSAQYHINNDIAYAIMQYFFASYDIDFLENKAFDILLECSRLWLDMGHYCEKGFCIDEVTGPDEYTCLVDNNFYTNVGAQHTMRYLLYAADLLKQSGRTKKLEKIRDGELGQIKKAADLMYIPQDKILNINPQDDTFLFKKKLDLSKIPEDKFPLLLHYHPLFLYRHQVCKQADVVLAHALYRDCANVDTKRNSFKYYEKICTHDSSLSLCAYAIMAAQLGMSTLAEKYFKATVDLDINNTHKNTMDGIHTANMGGSFLVMSKGFAGIYLDENGLSISPNMTKDIDGYSFKMQYRGRVLKLEASKTHFCIQLLSGESVKIYVYDKEIELKDKYEFEIK